MKKRHFYKGFTLVELVVTLAVASIILSIAVPSFRNMIQNNRATTYANQFIADLSLARIEAIKRGETVYMTSVGSNWNDGWRIWVDADGDDNYDSGEEIKETAKLQNDATLTNDSGLTQIGFLSTGLIDLEALEPGAPAWPSTFSLRIPDCSGDQGRDIQLHQTGRPTTETVYCT